MKKFLYLLFVPIVCFILAMAPYSNIHAASAFTHSHNSSCYSTVTFYCNSNHSISKRTENDGSLKHCYTCNAQTSHLLVSHYVSCQYVSGTYVSKAEYVCSVCGRVHAAWGPGEGHNVSRQELSCGIGEGAAMGTLSLSTGQTGWTNQNVKLNASINKLNDNLTLEANPYSWNGGSTWTSNGQFEVSQNGTYTVQAKNSQGAVISASVTVENIDKIPPVIEGVVPDTASMTKAEIQVAVRAADAGAAAGQGASGLSDTAYSADGGRTWQSSPVFLLKEGTAYELAVKDKAGNEARQSLSRSQFPYPPEPEKPQPADKPSNDAKPDDSNQSGSNPSGNGSAEDNSSSGGSGQSGNQNSGSGGSGNNSSSGGSGQSGNQNSGSGGSGNNSSSGGSGQSGNQNSGSGGSGNNSSSGSSGQAGNGNVENGSSAGGSEQPAGGNTGSSSSSDGSLQQENKVRAGKKKQLENKGKTDLDASNGSISAAEDGGYTKPDLRQELERRKNMLWVEKGIVGSINSRTDKTEQERTRIGAAAGMQQPVKVERQETDKDSSNMEGTDWQQPSGQAGADGGNLQQPEEILQGSLYQERSSSGLSSAGKAAASILALGITAVVLISGMNRVTVYCYRADRRYSRLGRVRVKKKGNGYEARLSGRLLQKAPTDKYRIAVHRFLRRSSKNNGFTVITPKRELALSLEEFVDFAL